MLTQEQIFEMASNASMDDVKELYEEVRDKDAVVRQMLRNVLSTSLMDGEHTDNNPLKCDIILYANESMGLSSNDMPVIVGISETECEGYLNLWIDGMEEPMDFDDLDTNEQVQVVTDLFEQINKN